MVYHEYNIPRRTKIIKEMVYMLSILALGIALGAAALVSGSTDGEENKEKEVTYDKDYCREHLSARHYDNWEVQTVAKAIQDSRVREQLERHLDHYNSFERAVDELVKEGQIRL